MRVLVLLGLLAFGAADMASFRTFATAFFNTIGLEDDSRNLARCFTTRNEEGWNEITQILKGIEWSNIEEAVKGAVGLTSGSFALLGEPMHCSRNPQRIRELIVKISKSMINEKKLRNKVEVNLARITMQVKSLIAAKEAKEFAKAGNIFGNFINWFYLNEED
eukprot:TRINITY_DN5242_c0_g1_i11.p2 TRINITY_DN5242_c0_g1~~TRINITY_DN5242_c0_g1_i11.p2  ORF type:complete len:163 (-),score=34.74 TRINITY_DN5242_c0_g1_i11:178-666(-)